MSTKSSPLEGPPVFAILRGPFDAIRKSPIILGVFLVSGLLQVVLPSIIGTTVRFLLLIVGVAIAARALGGQIGTDSPFLLRLFVAFLALLASYLLIVIGILALAIPSAFRWLGLLVLIPLGIYVYIRLFLSIPAVMVDGHGPAEALSESWRLMNGSVLATTFALVLVFIGGIFVLLPPFLLIGSTLIVEIGNILILDSLVAGMQAFLYLQLAETP